MIAVLWYGVIVKVSSRGPRKWKYPSRSDAVGCVASRVDSPNKGV